MHVSLHPYKVHPYHGVIAPTVLEAANSIFVVVYGHGACGVFVSVYHVRVCILINNSVFTIIPSPLNKGIHTHAHMRCKATWLQP